MARIRRVWALLWPLLLVVGFLNLVYGAGYYRGRSKGFEDGVKATKEAVFGAIERLAAVPDETA